MTEEQISSGLRLIVDLNLDKINDMLLIRPKFDIFPPNDFLPRNRKYPSQNFDGSIKCFFIKVSMGM
ncbi:hypothetical protein JY97_00220 [Alkalispirochaeta odontotermitis]|nr:hypothetical protein JY97_00220 [Alkalispirochaeta odontotermitis]